MEYVLGFMMAVRELQKREAWLVAIIRQAKLELAGRMRESGKRRWQYGYAAGCWVLLQPAPIIE